MMKCQCSQAGYCESLGRTMSKRQFAACRQGAFEDFAALEGRSTGLGDVVAKVTRATGIQKAAKAVAKLRGKPCGCSERQDKLNAVMPFTNPPQP